MTFCFTFNGVVRRHECVIDCCTSDKISFVVTLNIFPLGGKREIIKLTSPRLP